MTGSNLKHQKYHTVNLLHSCTGPSSPVHFGKERRDSTYRACLLEVSIFCRRSLHNSTYRGGKVSWCWRRWWRRRGSRFEDGWDGEGSPAAPSYGGSGCGNDTDIVSRLHRCIAETTASTAAVFLPFFFFFNSLQLTSLLSIKPKDRSKP